MTYISNSPGSQPTPAQVNGAVCRGDFHSFTPAEAQRPACWPAATTRLLPIPSSVDRDDAFSPMADSRVTFRKRGITSDLLGLTVPSARLRELDAPLLLVQPVPTARPRARAHTHTPVGYGIFGMHTRRPVARDNARGWTAMHGLAGRRSIVRRGIRKQSART